ncbi:hypothetical protein PILCRDRAFT_815334 [Piloderma croceum F 1598]|uniref:Uncharacterized protein n=1 Tax=Piloderma croceum (strain F 1598) TaxID=765440 RepID=A0A0C3FS56_PILCF|nr:hypothetical protein PILCRDRAFT_815334 [Piloderma croceum F 1598]
MSPTRVFSSSHGGKIGRLVEPPKLLQSNTEAAKCTSCGQRRLPRPNIYVLASHYFAFSAAHKLTWGWGPLD